MTSPPAPPSPPGAATLRDTNEDLALNPVRPRRALTMLARALRVRCPSCGGGPVLVHWLRMRGTCGSCGLPLERGERDYFIGSMMWNLVLSEFLFVGAFIATLVASWPAVHWDAIQVIAPAGMVVTPFILFPVSKLMWLAFDLMLRPERATMRALQPPSSRS